MNFIQINSKNQQQQQQPPQRRMGGSSLVQQDWGQTTRPQSGKEVPLLITISTAGFDRRRPREQDDSVIQVLASGDDDSHDDANMRESPSRHGDDGSPRDGMKLNHLSAVELD
jgi:hypothetical protein